MLGTVALDQRVCPASKHVCSTFSQPAAQESLQQGRMFDYVALNQHLCLKPSSYVCDSFTRLAGMLQFPCFKFCFEPTGMLLAVAPDHLHAGTSFRIIIDQHACLIIAFTGIYV